MNDAHDMARKLAADFSGASVAIDATAECHEGRRFARIYFRDAAPAWFRRHCGFAAVTSSGRIVLRLTSRAVDIAEAIKALGYRVQVQEQY